MGNSVDINIYNLEELEKNLVKAGCSDKDMLRKILAQFGTVKNGLYVLCNNEYYGESPFYNLSSFLDKFFQIDNSHNAFWDTKHDEGIVYKEIFEAEEELGVTLEDSEE